MPSRGQKLVRLSAGQHTVYSIDAAQITTQKHTAEHAATSLFCSRRAALVPIRLIPQHTGLHTLHKLSHVTKSPTLTLTFTQTPALSTTPCPSSCPRPYASPPPAISLSRGVACLLDVALCSGGACDFRQLGRLQHRQLRVLPLRSGQLQVFATSFGWLDFM